MRSLLSVVLLCTLSFSGVAQLPPLQWQRCYGGLAQDIGVKIFPAADGGFGLAGFVASTSGDISGHHGHNDAWFVKLNSVGSIEWQRAVGGSKEDRFLDGVQTPDGGYVLAGMTLSNDGDLSGLHGTSVSDALVVKLSSTGELLWQKCLGGKEEDIFLAVINTSDGGLLACGYTASTDGDVQNKPYGLADVWLVKLTASGAIEWQRTYGGIDGSDVGWFVTSTADGGYAVAGYTSSGNTGHVSGRRSGLGSDVWIVRVDAVGTFLWQKCLGGSGLDFGRSIVHTADGGFILSADSESKDGDVTQSYGMLDIWAVKLDSVGGVVWQKNVGGSRQEYASDVIVANGKYVVSGRAESTDGDMSGNHGGNDGVIAVLSDDGTLDSTYCFGGSADDELKSMAVLPAGGFVLAGTTASADAQIPGYRGNKDLWVVVLSDIANVKKSEQSGDFAVYPNPSTDVVSIAYTVKASGPVTVGIVNALGVTVYATSAGIQAPGQYLLPVDLSHLPKGAYTCTIRSQAGVRSVSFVQQ